MQNPITEYIQHATTDIHVCKSCQPTCHVRQCMRQSSSSHASRAGSRKGPVSKICDAIEKIAPFKIKSDAGIFGVRAKSIRRRCTQPRRTESARGRRPAARFPAHRPASETRQEGRNLGGCAIRVRTPGRAGNFAFVGISSDLLP